MKRLFLVLCLLLFLFSTASAELIVMPMVSGGGVAGTDCPTGTYLFAWNGDYSIGGADTDKGCFNNGASTKDGTLAGAGALSTDYGESGSVGFRYTADGDFLKWLVASADGLDPTEGTIYIRIKALTTAAHMYPFDGYYDTNNKLHLLIYNSNEVRGNHTGAGTTNGQTTSNTITDNTWTTIGFAWKVNEAGNDMGATHQYGYLLLR